MIDLFSLVHLTPEEPVQHIYRSHALRLACLLFFPFLFLVLPWFFFFDYQGKAWALVGASWLVGGVSFWYALDVWSSSLVIQTSRRVIGVARERFGRVRVHECAHHEVSSPEWKPYRLFPWLGRLIWYVPSGEVAHILGWIRPLHEVSHGSLLMRRFFLMKELLFAKKGVIEKVEADVSHHPHHH